MCMYIFYANESHFITIQNQMCMYIFYANESHFKTIQLATSKSNLCMN